MENTDHRLLDRVAIVTGASSGLGRAIALLFAKQGASLVVCADLKPDAQPNGVDEEPELSTHELICRRYGASKASFVRTDVTNSVDVDQCVREAVKLKGKLDIIVNNAGLGVEGTLIHESDEAVWDKMIAVNLKGPYLGCKHACAQFMKQDVGPDGQRGWIINMSSILGAVGYPAGPAYCASKGGVINLTKQVAIDYAPHKIHCNAVLPGFSWTAMSRAITGNEEVSSTLLKRTPWGTFGQAADIASAVVFLASNEANWMTGVALPVDGGFLAT